MVKALPETTISGAWLSDQIDECIEILADCGFNVRAVVTDNHSANVNAFSNLQTKYGASCYYIEHEKNNNRRTYLFYDNVHLLKNIRNNLLNVKKYVFPTFESKIGEETFSCPAGYISWSDLRRVYDKDKDLQGNLRKGNCHQRTLIFPRNHH